MKIDCTATDINWILNEYKSEIDVGVGGGQRNIKPLRDCLCTKCPDEAGEACN